LTFDISDNHVVPIKYTSERIPFEFLENDPSKGVSPDFVSRLVSTKFEHWRYENEVRLVYGLDETTIEDGSYFVSFDPQLSLREVVLGPLCEIPVAVMKSLLDGLYSGVVVRKARLAFKSFDVVPDQRHES
jgi:hypothetical protein